MNRAQAIEKFVLSRITLLKKPRPSRTRRWLEKKAIELRLDASDQEIEVKHALNQASLSFDHSAPILNRYIADFLFDEAMVILEYDGSYHEGVAQKENDQARDALCRACGFEVVRWNRFTCHEQGLAELRALLAARGVRPEHREAYGLDFPIRASKKLRTNRGVKSPNVSYVEPPKPKKNKALVGKSEAFKQLGPKGDYVA